MFLSLRQANARGRFPLYLLLRETHGVLVSRVPVSFETTASKSHQSSPACRTRILLAARLRPPEDMARTVFSSDR
jgi:hypothetical protein